MGEMVEFPSNGKTCSGYLTGPGGEGPGVVVIQEWWGLNDNIKSIADRFAAEGYVALAPDLFRGKITKEPGEAAKLMMDLKLEQAGKDMSGAVDFLESHEKVQPKKIGSVGFCMGGSLALVLATLKPIDACVSFYGLPAQAPPEYSKIRGAVLGHFAEHDDWASKDIAKAVFEHLQELGKPAEFHVYEGTSHAFFNDTRAEVHKPEASKLAWERTLAFYDQYLR